MYLSILVEVGTHPAAVPRQAGKWQRKLDPSMHQEARRLMIRLRDECSHT